MKISRAPGFLFNISCMDVHALSKWTLFSSGVIIHSRVSSLRVGAFAMQPHARRCTRLRLLALSNLKRKGRKSYAGSSSGVHLHHCRFDHDRSVGQERAEGEAIPSETSAAEEGSTPNGALVSAGRRRWQNIKVALRTPEIGSLLECFTSTTRRYYVHWRSCGPRPITNRPFFCVLPQFFQTNTH